MDPALCWASWALGGVCGILYHPSPPLRQPSFWSWKGTVHHSLLPTLAGAHRDSLSVAPPVCPWLPSPLGLTQMSPVPSLLGHLPQGPGSIRHVMRVSGSRPLLPDPMVTSAGIEGELSTVGPVYKRVFAANQLSQKGVGPVSRVPGNGREQTLSLLESPNTEHRC